MERIARVTAATDEWGFESNRWAQRDHRGESVIVFVKKTFRYRTVFFYKHLYHSSVCRNVFLKSGINAVA
jgi:hypothetical protein